MLYSALAASVLALAASAQSALTVNTPTSMVQCQPTLLTWTGGQAPFYVTIIPGGNPSGTPMKSWTVNEQQQTWTVDIAAGTKITVAIKDATGEPKYSAEATVGASDDTSCIGAGGDSSSTGGAAAGGDSSASAGGDAAGASTPAGTGAGSTAASTPAAGAPSSGAGASSGAGSSAAGAGSSGSAATKPSGSAGASTSTTAAAGSAGFKLAASTGLVAAAGAVALALF